MDGWAGYKQRASSNVCYWGGVKTKVWKEKHFTGPQRWLFFFFCCCCCCCCCCLFFCPRTWKPCIYHLVTVCSPNRCHWWLARHLGDSDLSSLLLAPSSNNPSLPTRDVPRHNMAVDAQLNEWNGLMWEWHEHRRLMLDSNSSQWRRFLFSTLPDLLNSQLPCRLSQSEACRAIEVALGEKLEELEPLMFQLIVTRAALKNDRKKECGSLAWPSFCVFHLCRMVSSNIPIAKSEPRWRGMRWSSMKGRWQKDFMTLGAIWRLSSVHFLVRREVDWACHWKGKNFTMSRSAGCRLVCCFEVC